MDEIKRKCGSLSKYKNDANLVRRTKMKNNTNLMGRRQCMICIANIVSSLPFNFC